MPMEIHTCFQKKKKSLGFKKESYIFVHIIEHKNTYLNRMSLHLNLIKHYNKYIPKYFEGIISIKQATNLILHRLSPQMWKSYYPIIKR
jgi:hypothetical protein